MPLRLAGWSRSRRTIILRRRVTGDLAVVDQGDPAQWRLAFAALTDDVMVYEYAVLITSRREAILTLAQWYAATPMRKTLLMDSKITGAGVASPPATANAAA